MLKKYYLIFYFLFILALLAPLITVTEITNFIFFTDFLYISISLSIFILACYVLNSFKPLISKLNLLDVLVLTYFLYNIFNLLFLNRVVFKDRFILLFLFLMLYFTLKNYFITEKGNKTFQHYFIISILIVTIIPIIIGLFEYTGFIPIFGVGFKITGGFLNPGVFANYLSSLLPFSLAVFVLEGNKSKFIKIFAICTFLVSLIIIIILNARTAWIAGMVSVIYVLGHNTIFVATIKRFIDSKIKKVIFIGSLLIVMVTSALILYNFKKDSADGRTLIWKICLNMIKEKPVFGNGHGTFPYSYGEHQIAYFKQNPQDIKNGLLAGNPKYAFNDYLQMMTDTGIIGGLLFLSFTLFILIKKEEPDDEPKTNYLFIGAKSGIMSIMLCALFSYPLNSAINFTLLIVFIAFVSSGYKPLKFNVYLSKKNLYFISFAIFLFISFILYNQLCVFRNSYKWKDAFSRSQSSDIANALETYKTLTPQFNNYYPFLFSYGSTLYNAGEYIEGIKIFEHAKTFGTNCNLYIYLGDCYKNTNRYKKAEECYNYASALIPHRLSPKYNLFKLYKETKQTEKAYKMAIIINDMQIKVYSRKAGKIKNEIIDFLNKNSNHKIF